jgi:hypothetical protein
MLEFESLMNIHSSGMRKERHRVKMLLMDYLDGEGWTEEKVKEITDTLSLDEEAFHNENISRYCHVCGDEYNSKYPDVPVKPIFGTTVHPQCAPMLEKVWERMGLDN